MHVDDFNQVGNPLKLDRQLFLRGRRESRFLFGVLRGEIHMCTTPSNMTFAIRISAESLICKYIGDQGIQK